MREELQKLATHAVAEALSLEDGAEVRVAGLIGEVRPITTRAGKRMAVVMLEDLSGAGIRAWSDRRSMWVDVLRSESP